MPQFWVVAGPNGAGKSTLFNKYLAGRLPIVNPDVIAQALAPTDPHGTQIRVQAGREAVHRQESLLAQGVDFAIETTLSGNRELALMRRARDAGYKMTLVYVGVDTPTTALGRIAQRVARGGHTVPAADVARRFARSLSHLATTLTMVDRAFVLDNTGRRYRLLLSMEYGQVKRLSRHLPSWAREALSPALLRSQGRDG
jgi:predicted ABC-type ATPase